MVAHVTLSAGLVGLVLASDWWGLRKTCATEVMSEVHLPVVIRAPNVASDSMKASSAFHAYLHASSQRDAAVADTTEARANAPAAYPQHLAKVIKAQNLTVTALSNAMKLQGQAVETVQGELNEMTQTYKTKEQALEEGRTGADFLNEAQDLKMQMAGS
mmetsp:Transcript_41224/g.95470  ORF Transcript_41224/g.95470 Transcript_41224/m.95470 type:complete len:159 (-) Transcript_41224:10-486(-)